MHVHVSGTFFRPPRPCYLYLLSCGFDFFNTLYIVYCISSSHIAVSAGNAKLTSEGPCARGLNRSTFPVCIFGCLYDNYDSKYDNHVKSGHMLGGSKKGRKKHKKKLSRTTHAISPMKNNRKLLISGTVSLPSAPILGVPGKRIEWAAIRTTCSTSSHGILKNQRNRARTRIYKMNQNNDFMCLSPSCDVKWSENMTNWLA